MTRVADDPRRGYGLRVPPGTDVDALARRLAAHAELREVRAISPVELRLHPSAALVAASLADQYRRGSSSAPAPLARGATGVSVEVLARIPDPEARAEETRLRARRATVIAETITALLRAARGAAARLRTERADGREASVVVTASPGGHVRTSCVGAVRLRPGESALDVPEEEIRLACLSSSPSEPVEIRPARLVAGAASPLGQVQAFHARLSSGIRYAAAGAGEPERWSEAVDASLVSGVAARELALLVLDVDDLLLDACRRLDPSPLVRYLGVLQAAHRRYHAGHRLVTPELEVREQRLVLAECTRRAVRRVLDLLALTAPESF